MHKITVPTGGTIQTAVGHIGDPAEPGGCILIYGVGYTDNAGALAYVARTPGATSELVTAAPADYLAQVAHVRAGGLFHVGVPASDAADATSIQRWPDLAGSSPRRHMRDVVAGS